MHDVDTPEMAELSQLAAKKRRFLWALFGNVVLLVVMLGGPFLRGIVRAHQLWRGFGRFEACVYGGKPNEDGGLGVPNGSEAHFAARLLSRAPEWPERCLTLLRAFTPDEPIFLLPSVKRAENDVRAAVDLVERELGAVLVRVPGERLSTRPLRAIEHLRSALSQHALTAGVFEVPAQDAFVLEPKHGLPIPTRVPIYASREAQLSLWGGDSELSGLALDSSGVSYVNVAAGSMNQVRLPRPKLLESFWPTSDGGYFVWAMARGRCRERAEGCAKKAAGVAATALPLSEVPFPRWLGAHPAGRIDRSMWFQGQRVLVVAEAPEKRLQVREFSLPVEPADKAASELPPLAASSTFDSVASGDVWIATLAGEPFVLLAALSAGSAGSESATELFHWSAAGTHSMARLPAGKAAWLSGVSCDTHVALSFGNEQALTIANLTPDATLKTWPSLELGLVDVVHERDASHDRLRHVCGAAGSGLVFVRDAKDTLRVIACAPGEAPCSVNALATGVQTFAVEALDDEILVAYAGAKNLAQVRLLTLDLQGQIVSQERTVSPCWAPLGGLCGTPVLERVGSRVLLGAREGTDLMLLESPDDGDTWEPLRGLKKHH